MTKLQSNGTSIIYLDTVYLSIGIRLNQRCRDITILSSFSRAKIIGYILGDGGLFYSKTSNYPYFSFTQTFKRFKYLWFSFFYLFYVNLNLIVINKLENVY